MYLASSISIQSGEEIMTKINNVLQYMQFYYYYIQHVATSYIRDCSSMLYVELAHAAPPTQYKAFMLFKVLLRDTHGRFQGQDNFLMIICMQNDANRYMTHINPTSHFIFSKMFFVIQGINFHDTLLVHVCTNLSHLYPYYGIHTCT